MKNLTTKQVMLAVAIAFVGVTGVAQANDDDDERECSVATLRGSYMFAASGYNIVAGAAQPKAIVESIRFHGDGALTVPAATVSINGTIMHSSNGTGTYTVAADCTGTLTFGPPGPTFDLFLAPKGSEFFMIQNTPGTVLQGRVVRLSP